MKTENKTKILLNSTTQVRDRYYLIDGNMGNAGEPENHVNHYYQIANGIDRGNGYQGYSSVSYFLTLDYIPQAAKDRVRKFCKEKNLIYTDKIVN
jgi:hypothetical protein